MEAEKHPPPVKVCRLAGNTSTASDDYMNTNYPFLVDPYNESDLRRLTDGHEDSFENSVSEANHERDNTLTGNDASLETGEARAATNNEEHASSSPKSNSSLWDDIDEVLQLHQQTSSAPPQRGYTNDDHVPPEQVTYNSIYSGVKNNGQAEVTPNGIDKTLQADNDLQTGNFYKDGNAKHKVNIISRCIDFSLMNEIKQKLDTNPWKETNKILEEYLSCPIKYQKVKDLISYLHQDIGDNLESFGQATRNSVDSMHLNTTKGRSGYNIIQLLDDVCRNMETKRASGENRSNNNTSVTDGSCGPSQAHVVPETVQGVPDVSNEMSLDKDHDGIIGIPNEAGPSSSSSIQPSIVVNADCAKDNLTDTLFKSLLSVKRSILLTTEQKISKMGQSLFNNFFSDEEILGGFARAQKNIPAYDGNRVYEISQIINFMLNENNHNESLLETFKSGQKENEGLDKENYKLFWKNVMIKYASDERKRIRDLQSN